MEGGEEGGGREGGGGGLLSEIQLDSMSFWGWKLF